MSTVITGSDLMDMINVGEASQSIFGRGGNDLIDAGGGDDVVFGDTGNDLIRGNTGNDVLIGDAGNDILDGGAGDDNLFGGAGADVLEGGTGKDIFAFDLADIGLVDRITDFTSGEDTIFIQGTGSNPHLAYDAHTGIVSVNDQAVVQLQRLSDGTFPTVDLHNDFFLA